MTSRLRTEKSLTFFNSVLTQTRTNPNHDEDGAVVEVGELCAQQDEEPEGGEGGEEGGHHPCQTHPRLK